MQDQISEGENKVKNAECTNMGPMITLLKDSGECRVKITRKRKPEQ